MRVTFVDGPLSGREEEIEDERLKEGEPIYVPSRPEQSEDDPATPGLDGAVEYLYEGEGRARYVGGQLAAE